MEVLNGEWGDRINHWLRTLKADFYQPISRISWEAYRTMEHLRYEEVQKKPFVSVKEGFVWGKEWEYCWFRGGIELPPEAAGKRIVLNLNPGGESCLFVNGNEFGTYRADWIACPHHYLVDNSITVCGHPGTSYQICMETYAGHYFPNCETGYCATGPVLPGSFQDPLSDGRRRTLGECTFGIFREEAYQLYLDADTLYRLLQVTDETSLRAVRIAAALKEFTYLADFEQDEAGRIKSYLLARNALKEVMEAENGSTAPVFSAVGNAHLDLAWLWPVAETKRKVERTFAAQLRLIEEYPQYRFIQSQPAAYEMCRQNYPRLFEKIKVAIQKKQWIADGAMWVEPDTNMASGEALIRQIMYGKQYYKEVLGVDSRVLWLPDTFGYTAALPQILAGCDVPFLVTQKIFWCCNDGEKFPYHYFYWEGMDGTKVTSFLPTSYTYQTDPQEVVTVWKNRTQKEDLENFLLPFGYGDGGGGPSRDHVEYVLRQRNLEGSPRMQMESPEEFFMRLEEAGGPQHTYTGELYFSSHRGTYTSQAAVKKNNRKCELAMREMEIINSFALIKGRSCQTEKADGLWKSLLFHQFHDILPGSSIARVYEETKQAQEKILWESSQMTQDAVNSLLTQKEGVSIINTLSFPRKALVPLPEEYTLGAVTDKGCYLKVQKIQDKFLTLAELPPLGGISLFPVRPKKLGESEKTAGSQARAWQDDQGYHLENEHIQALVDTRGRVSSYRLKLLGREFAAAPMNEFRIFKDIPRHFDAWDIDENYRNQEMAGAYAQQVTIISQGLEAVHQGDRKNQ